MNILFVCNFPINKNKPMGGVDSVVYSFMCAAKNNINNKFYFFRVVHSKKNQLEIIKDGPIKLFIPPKTNYIRSFILSRNLIKTIIKKENIDIINFIGSGPMLFTLPRKSKIPIVITQHGILSEELKHVRLRKKPKFFIKSIVDKFYLPFFHNRIFISEYTKRIVGDRYNFAIIPNPIHVNVSTIIENKVNVESRKPEVVVVGNISRLKNQKLAISALVELLKLGKDFKIKIIGNIKEKNYYKELRAIIDKNEIVSSRVIIIEGLNRDATLLNIKNADILLVTSLQENIPMVIGEAMLLSRIVVAPEIGGIPEMIVNKETGYTYKSNDLKSLCNALLLAIEQNENNEFLRIYAKDWATKTYSPESVLKKTIEFFQYILNENRKK